MCGRVGSQFTAHASHLTVHASGGIRIGYGLVLVGLSAYKATEVANLITVLFPVSEHPLKDHLAAGVFFHF